MEPSNKTTTKVSQPGVAGWLHGTRGALLRWTGALGLVAGAAVMGSAVMNAPHADATIRFCTATVCIGSANGCSTQTTVGVVIEAEDGDSFIDSHGIKWTCNHGKWVKTAAIVSQSAGITNAGATLQVQGDPGQGSANPVGATRADTGALRLAR